MNEFKTYHPIVNLVYFVLVIGFSCFFMHPVCLAISLTCAFTYSVMLKGRKAVKTNLIYTLPMLLLMAIINPLFNHEGITVIKYFPNGNPLTMESIIYGFCTAVMIVSVIMFFSCYNEVMSSDKFIYLFGKVIPRISLVISMTLRFVPRFVTQLKIIVNTQRTMGKDARRGSVIKRVKNALSILSVMTTWALENSIDTADSMKARGYGLEGRTAFSIYTFDKRDKKALICILFFGIYTLAGKIMGKIDFSYFPSLEAEKISFFGVSVFIAYLMLCMYPVLIELWEVRRWKALR